jgi:ATPase family AAA domain-containing protein 2
MNIDSLNKKKKEIGDIQPLIIDKTVNFDSIGGLKDHIQSLKEMVMLPLLYPEIFEKFKITPPKGVIFYGQPGIISFFLLTIKRYGENFG